MANLKAEGIVEGVTLTGDLMQDLAARVGRDVRDPTVLDEIRARLAPALWGRALGPGAYLFATIHRQENRAPDQVRAWGALLRAVALPTRPVILALHPGTGIVLDREHVTLGPDVIVVEPQGYRTSLALQLHAAAVLTDSGGVQREAAWLGVPCLVLRDATEWTEALAGAAGGMVLVGSDPDRAVAALATLAPVGRSEQTTRERAHDLDLHPAGAARAITEALSAGSA